MITHIPWVSLIAILVAFTIYIIIILLITIGNVQILRWIRTVRKEYSVGQNDKNNNQDMQIIHKLSDTTENSEDLLSVNEDDDRSSISSISSDGSVPLLSSSSSFGTQLIASNGSIPLSTLPPTVSIIKPLKGIEENLEICLESFFHIQYNQLYEILFTISSISDPAYNIARKLIYRYPHIDARIIIDKLDYNTDEENNLDSQITILSPAIAAVDRFPSYANPKVSNCSKGVYSAKYTWILLSDSNVRVPYDYLTNLTKYIKPDVGLISSSIVGIHSQPITFLNKSGASSYRSFGHQIELFMLNIHINRCVAICHALNIPVVSGKVIFVRKELMDNYSDRGFNTLLDYMAEDFMSGYFIRQQNYKIVLTKTFVEQHVSQLTIQQCWDRHLRWGRLRKTITIWGTILELFGNSIVVGIIGAVGFMIYQNINTMESYTSSNTIEGDLSDIQRVTSILNWQPFYKFFLTHLCIWYCWDYLIYHLILFTYDTTACEGIKIKEVEGTINEYPYPSTTYHTIKPYNWIKSINIFIENSKHVIFGYEYPFILIWLCKELIFGAPLWFHVIINNTINWKGTIVKIGKNTLIIPKDSSN